MIKITMVSQLNDHQTNEIILIKICNFINLCDLNSLLNQSSNMIDSMITKRRVFLFPETENNLYFSFTAVMSNQTSNILLSIMNVVSL